jgi:hypothetical protein
MSYTMTNDMWQSSIPLQEIVHDKLFIGSTKDDLTLELRSNTQLISFDENEKTILSVGALEDFFNAVIANRRQQILDAKISHGMIFYLWHDEMASQLRFSVISDFHEHLPFKAKIVPAELSEILQTFLATNSVIPWSDLTIEVDSTDAFLEMPAPEFSLNVFKIHLP